MSKTTRSIGTLLRNPMVQRVLAWGLPIVVGWILSKFDKPSTTGKKK
jgi:hypothetical protein